MTCALKSADIRCVHDGKVEPNDIPHGLTSGGECLLTDVMVTGARVTGCKAPPPIRCKTATMPLFGFAPAPRGSKQRPLLMSAGGLTDGPGTWMIRGGESAVGVGGGPAAPVAARTPPRRAAARTAGTKKGAAAKKVATLKVVLSLDLSPATEANGGRAVRLPGPLDVQLVVVQGDRSFSLVGPDAGVRVWAHGKTPPIDTGLDPAKPAFVVATTHRLTNAVWAFEPADAPPVFVVHPPEPATDIRPHERWKSSFRAVAAAAGVPGVDAKVLARANGIDPAKADKFSGWAVVRVPVRLNPKGGTAGVVLRPLYPRLVALDLATRVLERRAAAVAAPYTAALRGRLLLALLCRRTDESFGHKLDGTFRVLPHAIGRRESLRRSRRRARGQEPSGPPPYRPNALYNVLLDLHGEQRETMRPVVGLARSVAELLATPDGSGDVAGELARYAAATPRSPLRCAAPAAPRGGGESIADYVAAAGHDEAFKLVARANAEITDVVKLADELDCIGLPPQKPLVSGLDREWWGLWFRRCFDRVLAAKPGRGEPPADLWGVVLAGVGWLAKVPVEFITRLSWLKDRTDEVVGSLVLFESFLGVEIGSRASRYSCLVTRAAAIEFPMIRQTNGTTLWVRDVKHMSTVGGIIHATTHVHIPEISAEFKGMVIDGGHAARRLRALGVAFAGLLVVKGIQELVAVGRKSAANAGGRLQREVDPDVDPTLQHFLDFGQLASEGGQAYFTSRAATAGAGVAAHLRWALAFKVAGGLVGVGVACLDFMTAIKETKQGNSRRAAVLAVSGAAGLATVVLVFVTVAPIVGIILVGISLATTLGAAALQRTNTENELAAVLMASEFGTAEAAAGKVPPPPAFVGEALAQWKRDYLRLGLDASADLAAVEAVFVRASCYAQVGRVQGVFSERGYPAACVWIAPRPERPDTHVVVGTTNVFDTPRQLEVRSRIAAVDKDGGTTLELTAGAVGQPGPPLPLPKRVSRTQHEFSRDPFVQSGSDGDGNRVILVGMPTAACPPVPLGRHVVPAGKRLAVVLMQYKPPAPLTPPAVTLTHLIESTQRTTAGWVPDDSLLVALVPDPSSAAPFVLH